nr:hypothetical protein BaRGS_002381 [Batillaria attramentaria]
MKEEEPRTLCSAAYILTDSLLFTVAFTATLQGGGPVTIGNSSPIKFDKVVTNIGNAYNSHTGVFTAPVSGTYGFFLSLKGANIPSPDTYNLIHLWRRSWR